jgi:hypothetical protein
MLGAVHLASGQNVSIQTRLDRPEIRIGEPAAIDMIIRTDNLPQTRFWLSEDSTGNARFRVLEFGALDTLDIGNGVKEIKARMIVTSFDSTLVNLPPIIVETPSGQARSKALALNVIAPQVDVSKPDDFKPIMDPWEEPYTLLDLFLILWTSWISYVIAGLLLIAILVYEYKRRARYMKPEKPIPVPTHTPLEQLQKRLAPLEKAPLETQQDFKAYYSLLTEGLRHYFLELWGIEALELTSSELIAALSGRQVDPRILRHLEGIFAQADFVKFAKSLPMPSEAHESSRLALELASELYAAQRPEGSERKEVTA